MKKLCVVIPIYKNNFSEEEERAVDRTMAVLKNRDIFFVAPTTLKTSYYEARYMATIVRFADNFFADTAGYSRLLLDIHFWNRFLGYQYMVIVQPDVVILSSKDILDSFVNEEYDYWGAPWPNGHHLYPFVFNGLKYFRFFLNKRFVRIGNGGLSIRKIETMIRILQQHPLARLISCTCSYLHEDSFFSYYIDLNFSAPKYDEACTFSMEEGAKQYVQQGGVTFGVHAYQKEFGSYKEVSKWFDHE